MPFYYDLAVAGGPNAGTPGITTSGSAGTELTFIWGKTAANQETVGIAGLYMASRFGTAGGAQARLKDNIGATAANGTAQTPRPRNLRGSVAAQSLWSFNASGLVSAGTTLTARVTVGFAQTGGMGGWVATEPTNKIQMMPNATNPVDVEVTALAASASVTCDMTIELGEGI